MPDAPSFPPLPESWEATRASLHAYAHGLAALPRALAPAHPKWWHASAVVTPNGLRTDAVPIESGGSLTLTMDVAHHRAFIHTSTGDIREFDLRSGATSTEFADEVLGAAAVLGVTGEVDRSRFESSDPRHYDEEAATSFWHALTNSATVLETHRSTLEGTVSPLQFWPHGFDVSFEWFGTRMEQHEQDGVITGIPAQLNFGFYPGSDAYFYANPWPFEESLTTEDLVPGAVWHTEGWQGTMLPYSEVSDSPDGASLLLGYYRRVFEVAGSSLME